MLRFGRSSGMLRSLAVHRRRISNRASVSSSSPMVAQTLSPSPLLPHLSPSSASPLLPLPISEAEVETLEARLIYPFLNRKALEEALIHTSYPNRGRSSLTDPPLPRSYKTLTKVGERSLFFTLRSYALVHLLPINLSPHKLARTALHLGLYDFLRRNSPKLDQKVQQFVREQDGEVLYSGIPSKVPKVLPDLLYAMMGALHADCGHKNPMAWDVMKLHLHRIFFHEDTRHSVATLADICKDHEMSLEFKNKLIGGRTTVTKVFINNQFHGSGTWVKKSVAEGLAALDALSKLPKYMLPEEMLPIDSRTLDQSNLFPLLKLDFSQGDIRICQS